MQAEEPWWHFVADRIAAWRLQVSLSWTTPTRWLDRINEVWLGASPETLPHAEWPHSCWVAVAHGELMHEPDRTTEPLLRAYRQILESTDSVRSRINRVRELLADPDHEAARALLPETTAEAWAVSGLTEAVRVGPAIAERLLQAGFENANAVMSATDQQLLAVPGIGPKRLQEIRTPRSTSPWAEDASASRFGLPEALARAACLEYSRRRLATKLNSYMEDGVQRVSWMTTGDQSTCARCRPLDGRQLSIADALDVVKGEFCDLSDWSDEAQGYSAEESAALVGPRVYFEHLPVGCRCTVTPVYE
jgi:hypothetical protein